ncbi:OstA-like protein [Balneolaceae bacterium ANBcel3]|nr:OstA-like protein [Balneolaceae bacterium ANBcel3]
MKKACIFLILYFFVSDISGLYPSASAQNRVRILHADLLEGTSTERDGRIRKLTGNVHIESDDFILYGDSAWQYLDQDKLHAYGNIEIKAGDRIILSDHATYDLISEIAWFDGRVIMQSDQALLFSNEAYYSFSTEIALFPESIRLEDQQGVLLADSGYYYNAIDSAIFRGHVQISDSLQYAEADSAFVRRGHDYYELHGEVYLEDLENQSLLTGSFVLADSTGYRRVEGGSFMRRIQTEEADTTYLWADWLEVMDRPSPHSEFFAYEHVRIWNPSYQSVSDTVHYHEASDRLMLTGNARLWNDETQLSGPSIRLQFENDSLRYIHATGRPFAVQNTPSTGRKHQITGDTLLLSFEQQELKKIWSHPNGHILYFINDENDQPDGAIEIEASDISIHFSEGELYDVLAKENVDGVFIPEHSGIEENVLDGYLWEPELRPTDPDALPKRRFSPIPPERPFSLPKRYRP